MRTPMMSRSCPSDHRRTSPGAALVGALASAVAIACKSPAPNPNARTPDVQGSGRGQADLAASASARVAGGASARDVWSPADTFAVVVGVLSFKDASIPSFAARHRKDQELSELLVRRGVPKDHVVTLLDRDAQAKAVLDSVSALASKAGPGSTFLFYYAGHGGMSDKGEVSFVAYDETAGDAATHLDLSKVEAAIGDHVHGARVLLLADCCHSGGLIGSAARLHKKGIDAAAITSADASNLSTGNWTFSQTVIDAFGGRPLLDRNGDGAIDLGEVADESADAMKYREAQRSGAAFEGLGRSFVVANDSGAPVARTAGPVAVGSYTALDQDGQDVVGRIVDKKGTDASVELYDYSDATIKTAPASALKPIVWRRYPVGSKLKVFSEGSMWPAEVTKIDGDFHFVTYPGWPSFWDEWVLSDRIQEEATSPSKHAKGDKVQVEWQGKYWPATVLDVNADRCLIHYDGYASSWDEWVPPSRMKDR